MHLMQRLDKLLQQGLVQQDAQYPCHRVQVTHGVIVALACLQELGLQPVYDGDGGNMTFPFAGITEYKDQYVPKETYPVLPPLTGVDYRQN